MYSMPKERVWLWAELWFAWSGFAWSGSGLEYYAKISVRGVRQEVEY
jgi:hypothetical protein